MKTRITISLTFIFVFQVSRTCCSGETPVPVVRVGHVGHDHHLALFVAADLGKKLKPLAGGVWLEELKRFEVYRLHQGSQTLAQLSLLKVGGGSKMPAAMSRGEIQVGLGGVAAVASAYDKGADIRLVAPLNCDGDMLLVNNAFPAKSWTEFLAAVRKSPKPVKIGYKAPRAVAYLILKRALKAEGITYGPNITGRNGKPVQVVLMNLHKGSNMVPSLARGVVDGFVMNQPFVALAENRKLGRAIAELRDLPPTGKWKFHPCCCLCATQKMLKHKRAIIVALVKALIAGREFIGENQAEAITIAAKWTRKPAAVENRSIPTVTYMAKLDNRWKTGMLTWCEMMLDLKQFTGKLKGMTPEKMYDAFTDTSVIEEAEKEL